MKSPWFKKYGWSYWPIHWIGFLILIIFVFFCGHIFLFVDHQSHSVSDTLYGIFPYFVPTFLLYNWIASHNI